MYQIDPRTYPEYRMTGDEAKKDENTLIPGSELIEKIYKAIVDEATAAEFYSRLVKNTDDELYRHFIDHARKDEEEHLRNFSSVYQQLTKRAPTYHITPVQYPDFREGVKKALQDELEAVEFYRNMILSSNNGIIGDVFFHAMIDELEHAIQFGVIYSTTK